MSDNKELNTAATAAQEEQTKTPMPKLFEKVKLTFPIRIDGAEVAELTVRRSKVSDHKAARLTSGGNSQDYEIHLFSRLTGVPIESFDDMDYDDYLKIQEAYTGFLSSVATTK